jgi:GxxExxY protein
MNKIIHQELSNKIIYCFYKVYNKLGFGFLEKVYLNAMMIELTRSGFTVEKQKQIKVYYDDLIIGEYYADIIVENTIILELKAAEGLIEEHELQLINYLKATEKEIGLLLNFGKKPEFRRKIFTNERKSIAPKNIENQ